MKKLLLLFCCAALLVAQRPSPTSPYRDADRKLFAEIEQHNELMTNIEYLCDLIGPRLTGTDKLKAANRWTLEKLKAYGLQNCRLEPRNIANVWRRGTAFARIVDPTSQTMTIASAGWSPSTNGAVRGRLVYVKARKAEDLDPYKGRLRGAILILSEPAKLPTPGAAPAPQPASALDAVRNESGRREEEEDQRDIPPEQRRGRDLALQDKLKSEGVAALLRDSSKEHALLNMGSIGGRDYRVDGVPTAYIIHEDYARLWRLLDRKEPVELEVSLHNEIAPGPVEVYNTMGEIRGATQPDEMVIIGAHLDSWDLATGATDNGTGSSVVLEAARALHAFGLHPRRTIRFILFTGEEQGLVGSRDYVKVHNGELDHIQGVVIHDTGTGRIKSFTMEGRYDLRETLDKLVAPLREIGLEELSMRRTEGSDHVPFREAGIPAFFGIQAPADYRKTHHSQSDTFDKVHKDELIQGAKAVAALAWNLSEYPEKLPRKKMEPPATPTTQ